MNRINKLFKEKNSEILSIYFCAGTPDPDGTVKTLQALQRGGVDMVEIGIPFSDPMADGPVIQEAATKALRGGMTLRRLFEQLRGIRGGDTGKMPVLLDQTVDIPLILMGYLNPIMQYGFERFCQSCREVGIDGVIIPDLPFKDYMEEYREIADRYDIRIIMLITPETSEERIRLIDENTDGFIYMVSSAAITGAQKSFNDAKLEYFHRIAAMGLRNPRMIGFGISNKQTYRAAADNAAGAIIGSRFVTLLDQLGDADAAIAQLRANLQE